MRRKPLLAGLIVLWGTGLGPWAPSNARADGVSVGAAVEGGAAWFHIRSISTPTIFEDSREVQRDGVHRWGPGAALQLRATGRVHSRVHVGGVARFGVVNALEGPFARDMRVHPTIGAGPTVRFEPPAGSPGIYGGIWAGFSTISTRWGWNHGWAAGIDAGYRWPLDGGWHLGLGASLATEWTYSEENGDHNHFEYLRRSLWTTLQLRMTWQDED